MRLPSKCNCRLKEAGTIGERGNFAAGVVANIVLAFGSVFAVVATSISGDAKFLVIPVLWVGANLLSAVISFARRRAEVTQTAAHCDTPC